MRIGCMLISVRQISETEQQMMEIIQGFGWLAVGVTLVLSIMAVVFVVIWFSEKGV